ncbi:hypothetical protein GCM10020331_082330 [Ectobacillus funiculus]
MNARTVNNIWTGILYALASLVVVLLVFFMYQILSKGWGFWDPDFFYLDNLATQELVGDCSTIA